MYICDFSYEYKLFFPKCEISIYTYVFKYVTNCYIFQL